MSFKCPFRLTTLFFGGKEYTQITSRAVTVPKYVPNNLNSADDTSIEAMIKNDKDVHDFHDVDSNGVDWCDKNYLALNVKKTIAIIFDFRKKGNA